jgi:hypothetical protein
MGKDLTDGGVPKTLFEFKAGFNVGERSGYSWDVYRQSVSPFGSSDEVYLIRSVKETQYFLLTVTLARRK